MSSPDPNQDNPYQAPQTPDRAADSKSTPSQRPTYADWFFAIFLGALAVAIVFPTTCFGGFMLFFSIVGLHSTQSDFSTFLFLFLAAVCLGLTIGAAVWVGRLYINHSIKAGEAQRMEHQNNDQKLD